MELNLILFNLLWIFFIIFVSWFWFRITRKGNEAVLFGDRKHNKIEYFSKSKKYDNKSMEWQYDEDDCRSIDSLSWSRRNVLEKSKSDSSITAIGDCNYKSQGIQVSLETCNTPKNITSTFKNLYLNDNADEAVENDTNFIPVIKDCHTYNQCDSDILQYGFKTKDITTEQLVIQLPKILNFQGNQHSPKEIAANWKKDCRMWLWKSVRFANRQMQ